MVPLATSKEQALLPTATEGVVTVILQVGDYLPTDAAAPQANGDLTISKALLPKLALTLTVTKPEPLRGPLPLLDAQMLAIACLDLVATIR